MQATTNDGRVTNMTLLLRATGGLVVAVSLVACANAEPTDGIPRRSDGGVGKDSATFPLEDTAGEDTSTEEDTTTPSDAAKDGATDGVADATKPPDGTTPPSCGNGKIEGSEVCDDGNMSSGDGCSADCSSVECTGTRTIEDFTTHHCYWRSKDVVSRSTAVTRCNEWGGYLARLQTDGERSAVFPTVLGSPGGKVWIGLQKQSGTWTWDDGAPATDLKWRSGEPSGDGNCVEWIDDDSYNDLSCSSPERDFVCERDPKGTK